MAKLTYQQREALAEEYFVNFGFQQKETAEFVGVTEATISKWAIKGKWKQKRQKFLASPSKVKELLFDQLEIIAKGDKPTIDSDSLSKVFKVIEGLGSRTAVPVVMSVLKEFDNWMSAQEPAKAIEFLEWHKKFILHKAAQDDQ